MNISLSQIAVFGITELNACGLLFCADAVDSAWKLFESSIPKLLGRALLECKATPSAGLQNVTAITFFSNKNLIVKIWLPEEKNCGI